MGAWRYLASGGFGEVFAVTRSGGAPGEPCAASAACKVFAPVCAHREDAGTTWRDFRHEVRMLVRAQGHPGVPELLGAYLLKAVRDAAEPAFRPALVTSRLQELLWPGAVRAHPAGGGRRVEEGAAKRYVLELLDALAHRHPRKKRNFVVVFRWVFG